MAVSKSLLFETEVPAYQRAAVEWLKGYRGTDKICDLLSKVRFTEQEIMLYRQKWEKWLKPKKSAQDKLHRGIH